jgi:hypothetical protein
MKVPESFRVKNGATASNYTYGNNGAFKVPLSNRTTAIIIASDGEGWEHVSAHIVSEGKERTPTWAEMCKIKDMFWDETETVVQFHPKKSDYVNVHKHCLHLWKQKGVEFNLPSIILV